MTSPPARERHPGLLIAIGALAVTLLVLIAVLVVVVRDRIDPADAGTSGAPANPPDTPVTCPQPPAALAPDAREQWSVEDPDGDEDDVTLGGREAICGGVLVTWEVWAPDDDERESPDHYTHAAYGANGALWWELESRSTLTPLQQSGLILLFDRDDDTLEALTATTGEREWKVDLEERLSPIDFVELTDRLLVSDEPGLGTPGGILHLADGSITTYQGSFASADPGGIVATIARDEPGTGGRDQVVRYDTDGSERWRIDAPTRIVELQAVVAGDAIGVTSAWYDEPTKAPDELVVLDAATGRERSVVPGVVSIAQGPPGTISALQRPKGARDRTTIVGDEPPGRVLLIDASGATVASTALDRVDAAPGWRAADGEPGQDTGARGVLVDRTGAILSADLSTVLTDRSFAGATAEGFYTDEVPGELALADWSTLETVRTMAAPGVGPPDDDASYWPPPVILDGAVVEYTDAAVRLYQ